MSMTNITDSPALTRAENDFLRHMMRWGSDGYPVQKSGSRWLWSECWGVKGAPTVYKTKHAAVEAVERYVGLLIDRTAGRV